MEEKWRDIDWIPEIPVKFYQISNLGRVRSISRIGKGTDRQGGYRFILGRILKPRICAGNSGYATYALTDGNNNQKNKKAHRLIAEAFIPNPNNLPQINHKDTNKLNNNISNLEWCTCLHNIQHAFANGLIKQPNKGKTGKDIKTSKELLQYDLKGNLIKVWDCLRDTMRAGLHHTNIGNAANGRVKSAHGFIWKYANNIMP